jgi:serine/threonine protein phosphatase 1
MALHSFGSNWEPAPAAGPENSTVFVVGDVHGHIEHLDGLLDLIRTEAAKARDRGRRCELVLVGDFVDRGPASVATLRRLAGLPGVLGFPVHALCGNHDRYLIEFLLAERPDPKELESWCGNGGLTTLGELGVTKLDVLNRDPADLAARARSAAGPEVLAVLRRLGLYRSLGGYVCVHAGISPGRPLDEQGRQEFLCLREPFLSGRGWRHGFTAVHGHTIRGPEVLPHRIAVDSGVYRTGVLTALQLADDRLRFLCVTSEPKLKAFKRLPGLEQGRRFSVPEPLAAPAGFRLAVGA